ncbi:unnamed protein product [Didymodactylos carnosus]|uniref:Uncharacterized protein n=1 Tax=Didymodactylos carnosus TaxID=1234261 RepID=A0A813SWB8_9BILA|nr:unnamed protein product [Didymodactylos carnosus]CAF1028850.1 unnamed protein product [Didymodactylos carnosus]CAF3590855.1 unnamed protein product [Didymodactylos carnosus]CAF3797238.1 unnamed protein product [Didymodactylos carnosus]
MLQAFRLFCTLLISYLLFIHELNGNIVQIEQVENNNDKSVLNTLEQNQKKASDEQTLNIDRKKFNEPAQRNDSVTVQTTARPSSWAKTLPIRTPRVRTTRLPVPRQTTKKPRVIKSSILYSVPSTIIGVTIIAGTAVVVYLACFVKQRAY